MLISLNALTKVYKVGSEEIHALNEVSLSLDYNGYIAVMGPSGSGKSTLMNLIGCLDRPTSGEYLLEGKEVSKLSQGMLAHVRNRRIGFVFQSFELLPRLTALRNVVLPLIYSPEKSWFEQKKRAKEVLERVGLSSRMHHRPNQLSGGERQRVAIARALVNNPSILMADEPTGNLDSRTGRDILALFEKLHKDGQTIIMVTHEQDVAEHAQRIVTMSDGRILSDAPVRRGESA